jgi:hypothetical protein
LTGVPVSPRLRCGQRALLFLRVVVGVCLLLPLGGLLISAGAAVAAAGVVFSFFITFIYFIYIINILNLFRGAKPILKNEPNNEN